MWPVDFLNPLGPLSCSGCLPFDSCPGLVPVGVAWQGHGAQYLQPCPSCSSRVIQLTFLSTKALCTCISYTRCLGWESENHSCLGRPHQFHLPYSWLTSLPRTENDPSPGLLLFSCHPNLPTYTLHIAPQLHGTMLVPIATQMFISWCQLIIQEWIMVPKASRWILRCPLAWPDQL